MHAFAYLISVNHRGGLRGALWASGGAPRFRGAPGDKITPGEDVSCTNSDFGVGVGCRCEANTNVPGAPRILDPPLVNQA